MFTEDRARWLYRHYRWLEQSLSPRDASAPRRAILPTPEFYPQRNTRDHAFATAVFHRTRELLDMTDWHCRLVAQDDDQAERDALLRGGVFGEDRSAGAAGTFSAGEEVVITYAPKLVQDPTALVATLAHELAHYLLDEIEGEPPAGNWDELEPLTDLTAVVEGFGVFLCNSAFNFSQWSDGQYQGWQSQTQGYLNAAELGFALGIFCVRTDTPAAVIQPHLKANPRQVFNDSFDFIFDLEHAGS